MRKLYFFFWGLLLLVSSAAKGQAQHLHLHRPDSTLRDPFKAWMAFADSIPHWPGDRMPVLRPDMSKLARMPVLKVDSLYLFRMPTYRIPQARPDFLKKQRKTQKPNW